VRARTATIKQRASLPVRGPGKRVGVGQRVATRSGEAL